MVPADAAWVRTSLTRARGSAQVARKDELVDASALPGLVALSDGARLGLAVYAVRGTECEVVSLSSEVEGAGVGQALLRGCVEVARGAGCRRLWLVTTNDSIRALAFYQRFGMDLCALHRNGADRSRRLKSGIPEHDEHGVRIAHELELELLLDRRSED